MDQAAASEPELPESFPSFISPPFTRLFHLLSLVYFSSFYLFIHPKLYIVLLCENSVKAVP